MHILRDVSVLKYQCNLFDQRTIWSTIFKTEEYQHISQQDSYTVSERLFCQALLGDHWPSCRYNLVLANIDLIFSQNPDFWLSAFKVRWTDKKT